MSRPVDRRRGDAGRPTPTAGRTAAWCSAWSSGRAAGCPTRTTCASVHDVLESAFADHFNSNEETFDEFLFRLREDPGHRWDHWWLAELVDDGRDPEPVGALVGTVCESSDGPGRLLRLLPRRARDRPRPRRGQGPAAHDHRRRRRAAAGTASGLEVDADSPTGADGLYTSMGWETKYVTESWHRDVPVDRPP